MRWTVILLALALAGCSSPAADDAPEETTDDAAGDAPPTPREPGIVEATGPATHWINGTFENVGQCTVWPQGELDRLEWHDLPNATRGASYETTVDATLGPPPAAAGGTGACLYFTTGETSLTGADAGSSQSLSGTVPSDAARVAMMTDAAYDGTFSIEITLA